MKLAITGCRGQVGHALLGEATVCGFDDVVALDRSRLDLTHHNEVLELLTSEQPDMIINPAAYTAVDAAEDNEAEARTVNRDAAGHLALIASDLGIPIIHLSTDYVFDGNTTTLYEEEAPTAPLGVYGASKLEGEHLVASQCARHIIIRTSWVFGDVGNNFVRTMLQLASERDELQVVADQYGCPTYAGSIAAMIMKLVQIYRKTGSLQWGTYHYCDQGPVTWHGFAQAIFAEALAAGLISSKPKVNPILTDEFPTRVQRPSYSVLSTAKMRQHYPAIQSTPWQQGLVRMMATLSSTDDQKTKANA